MAQNYQQQAFDGWGWSPNQPGTGQVISSRHGRRAPPSPGVEPETKPGRCVACTPSHLYFLCFTSYAVTWNIFIPCFHNVSLLIFVLVLCYVCMAACSQNTKQHKREGNEVVIYYFSYMTIKKLSKACQVCVQDSAFECWSMCKFTW